GAGRTSDGNGSHASTLKSPSYTKSVSWQHYPVCGDRVRAFHAFTAFSSGNVVKIPNCQ
ncbi:transposase, partial [Escherichia coli]